MKMKNKRVWMVILLCCFTGMLNASTQAASSQIHTINRGDGLYYRLSKKMPATDVDGVMISHLNGAGFSDGSFDPTFNLTSALSTMSKQIEKSRQVWLRKKMDASLLQREQRLIHQSALLSYNRALAIGQPYTFSALQSLLRERSRYAQKKMLAQLLQQQRLTNRLLRKLIIIEQKGKAHA